MQDQHKKAIQENFGSLVHRTDLTRMVLALREKGVFSEHMLECYENESKSPMDRKRRLYSAIMRRGPDAFDKLLEALMEMGHWDLVRDLDRNSPLHTHPSRSDTRNPLRPPVEQDENNYVSIKTKKREAQKNLGISGGSSAAAAAAEAADPVPPATLFVPTPPNNGEDAIDLCADIPDFHVKKSTSFFEEDESKGLRLYRTRGRNRGFLLLLSYVDFAYGTDEFRHGVEMDTKNLKYLFSEMGFKVLTYKNLTLDETEKTLQSLERVLEGTEIVFTVVSSHGYALERNADTAIRCSDGHLTSDGKIIEFFNHRNMPALLGVPKVFIFQVCRGKEDDFIHVGAPPVVWPPRISTDAGTDRPTPSPLSPTSPTSTSSYTSYTSPPRTPVIERPLYSDTLVVHSTVPGFVSHRDRYDGSWYVQVLCEVFAESAHDCHVDKLFKLVDDRLQDRYHIQTSSVDSRGFNKKLYLHPGLYETP